MPADLLPRIFEPYVTTKTKGMGLGLAPVLRRTWGLRGVTPTLTVCARSHETS